MKLTVTNLTGSSLSTDVGRIDPYASLTVSLPPADAERAASSLTTLETAGRISIAIDSDTGTNDRFEQLTLGQLHSTAAASLYVASTGLDTNPGTSAKPFLTIQAALNSLPKSLRHPTTITVGTGSYGAYQASGFTIEPSTTSTPNSLVIQGTLVTATVATGTATGTLTAFAATSGATFAVMTDGAQTWTVNDLRGKMVEFTSGTGSAATAIFLIASNTATTATLICLSSQTGGVTTTYAIRDWGTTINTTLPATTATMTTSATDSANGIRLNGNMSGSSGGNAIVVAKMAVTLSSQTLISSFGPGRTTFAWLKLSDAGVTSASAVALDVFDTASTTVHACYVNINGSGLGVRTVCGSLTVTRCYFEGMDTQVWAGGRVIVGNSYHRNSTFAAIAPNFNGTPGTHVIANSRLDTGSMGVYGISDTSTGVGCRFIVGPCDITGFTTGAVVLATRAISAVLTTITGTTNAVGIKVITGAYCKVNAASTLTGTIECIVDTTNTDLATMRAATPKVLPTVASLYGSVLCE